jgi:ubiquitin-conjugating enzyme E2 D
VVAPEVKFLTKVFHPNIDEDGKICCCQQYCPCCIGKMWTPAIKMKDLLWQIRQLMIDPNPDDPLVPEIANLYKKDRNKYESMVKEWVHKYASAQ